MSSWRKRFWIWFRRPSRILFGEGDAVRGGGRREGSRAEPVVCGLLYFAGFTVVGCCSAALEPISCCQRVRRRS